MNRYNAWQTILEMANEDLERFGYSILLVEPEEGFYSCDFWKDGELVETYAENYYEDELCALLTDAWHDLKLQLV